MQLNLFSLLSIFPIILYALLFYKKRYLGTGLMFLYSILTNIFLSYFNDSNYFGMEMSSFFNYLGFFSNVILTLFIYEVISSKNSAFLFRKRLFRMIFPIYTLIPILALTGLLWIGVFMNGSSRGYGGLGALILTGVLLIVYCALFFLWVISYCFKEAPQEHTQKII